MLGRIPAAASWYTRDFLRCRMTPTSAAVRNILGESAAMVFSALVTGACLIGSCALVLIHPWPEWSWPAQPDEAHRDLLVHENAPPHAVSHARRRAWSGSSHMRSQTA